MMDCGGVGPGVDGGLGMLGGPLPPPAFWGVGGCVGWGTGPGVCAGCGWWGGRPVWGMYMVWWPCCWEGCWESGLGWHSPMELGTMVAIMGMPVGGNRITMGTPGYCCKEPNNVLVPAQTNCNYKSKRIKGNLYMCL